MINPDGKFFKYLVLLLVLLALVGFAPSYYLRSVLVSSVELNWLMHLHGLAFTLWMVLLVIQVSFISAGKLLWHRRCGYASVALAILMMGLSAALALERTQVWLADPSFDAVEVLQFVAIPTTTILYFSGMYGAAIYYRQQPAIHKRLMMIASFDIFTPAVARLPYLSTLSSTYHYAIIDLLLIAVAVHDWRTLKRLHPATLLGACVLIASQVGREVLSKTDVWMDVAFWLTD